MIPSTRVTIMLISGLLFPSIYIFTYFYSFSSCTVHSATLISPQNDEKDDKLWWEGSKECLLTDSTLIGRGAHGTVYKATKRTDFGEITVAVKTILVGDGDVDGVEEEAKLHQSCHHSPFIIRLFDVLKTDLGRHVALVMEFGGRTLESIYNSSTNQYCLGVVRNNIDERVARCRYIAWCLLKATHHLHDHFHLAHLDINPKNILVSDSGTIKLCDFDCAKRYHGVGWFRGVVGTPSYCSPDVLLGRYYGEEVDFVAIGLVILFTDQLQDPFHDCTLADIRTFYKKNDRSIFSRCRDDLMPVQVRQLIATLCVMEWNSRQFIHKLDLFRGCNWNSDHMEVPFCLLADLRDIL